MAGITPVGQPNSGAPTPDGAAVDLAVSGASGSNLASLLSAGDVVSATVVGSNGAGQDVIEILGQKIIAQLPPTLVPGEQILLQVVSVDGNNIVTRNLGEASAATLPDGSAAVATPERPIPPPLVPGSPPVAPNAPASGAAGAVPAGAVPAAPSSAVFVAASVQPSSVIVEDAAAPPPAPVAGAPVAPGAAAPPAASGTALPQGRAIPTGPPGPPTPPATPASAPAPAVRAPSIPGAPLPPATTRPAQGTYSATSGVPVNPERAPLQSVEMRIAAARAETAARTSPPAPVGPGAQAPRRAAPAQSAPPAPNAPAAPPAAPSTQAIINRLTIAHRDLGAEPPKGSTPPSPASASFAKPPPAAEAANPSVAAAQPGRPDRSPLAFGAPPATPLRAAPAPRLEPTSTEPLLSPSELIAARSPNTTRASTAAPVLATPAQAAPAAAAPSTQRALLELLNVPQTATTRAAADVVLKDAGALPQTLRTLDAALATAGDDPRVLAARTIASFISDLDPSKPTLATQLQSYVDHVASGSEQKLATLLGAQAASDVEKAAPPPAQANAEQLLLPIPGIADAHAAERGAALDHNLKSLLLSLAASPPADGGATTASAIQNALTQITATQLQTLQSMQTNPGAFTFAIPLPWPGSGQNAELHIWRDAPGRGGALTTDDFHIAFVLNTANLGTVAVDLQSVGRGVKVGVKTEESGAAGTFRNALGALGERLETLKYRVVKLDADVAARGAVKAEALAAGHAAPVPVPQEDDPNVTLDLRI